MCYHRTAIGGMRIVSPLDTLLQYRKHIYIRKQVVGRNQLSRHVGIRCITSILLTPMDRATLLHVKSTMLHCPPRQTGNERRSIANCYADREMSVITTYLNDNAHTPLNRSVAGIPYNQVCNKCSDKSNRWSLGLSLRSGFSTAN